MTNRLTSVATNWLSTPWRLGLPPLIVAEWRHGGRMSVGKETAVRVKIFDSNGWINLKLWCVLWRFRFILPQINWYPPITNAMLGSWWVVVDLFGVVSGLGDDEEGTNVLNISIWMEGAVLEYGPHCIEKNPEKISTSYWHTGGGTRMPIGRKIQPRK